MSTVLVRVERRDLAVSYGLWLAGLFGICGLHRFYQGRWISGLLWFMTWGLCGVGQLIDVVMMPKMIEDVNAGADVW